MEFNVKMGWVHEPIFDSRFYKLREGEIGLINVMLIDWYDDFAKRVAIGCIHKDAWTNVSRKGRYVGLI